MGRRKRKTSPFNKILCGLMDKHRMTLKETSKIANVPISTLSNWRSGAIPDDHMAIKRLANHFLVSMSYLLTGENDLAATISPRNECGNVGDPRGAVLFDGQAKITILCQSHDTVEPHADAAGKSNQATFSFNPK